MTDNRTMYNEYSRPSHELTDAPPQPPPHDLQKPSQPNSPTPSKSIQRSKTVQSKVRGLFKKYTPKDTDANKANASAAAASRADADASSNAHRPTLFTSSSLNFVPTTPTLNRELSDGQGSALLNDLRISTDNASYKTSSSLPRSSYEVEPQTMTATVQEKRQPEDMIDPNEPLPAEAEELLQELEQINAAIARAKQEVATEAERKQALHNELEEAKRNFQAREQEYTEIEHNFFELTRAVRATDDDLSTIRDSFKLLKYSIARMIMTLNKKADKAKATEKFVSIWPELTILEPTGELEPGLINLLAEKLVHMHLIQNVFRCPVYPGLSVNDAFSSLSKWLMDHDSQFSVRLRQQLASIIVKSGKDGELQQAAQTEKIRIAELIYKDLADIYHPFIRENDESVDEEKRYFAKITDILDKALKLAIAMRGQEVDISTVDIEEGKQAFDEETMVDVKGKTSGVVRFCICPAFAGGDGEHGFLEKGKVVVG
ncbi:uncharacterized protein BYT42DRAFT_586513 [Radiomyces spectabilis]|uniref:uncharacterized protein n=1 Tax=Radiomyces spectabilis TaxID=64574 RepID=UPI002220C363|nr:uncharacterized protein BYT42DRAFT_586513 [Radiomyces spectabilis]KAI8367506.1 hypothetical protein BYT42DRAFT_586513 [Radiomyces spectabilis]